MGKDFGDVRTKWASLFILKNIHLGSNEKSYCYGFNCRFPLKSNIKVLTPQVLNVTVFEDRIYIEVIKVKGGC